MPDYYILVLDQEANNPLIDNVQYWNYRESASTEAELTTFGPNVHQLWKATHPSKSEKRASFTPEQGGPKQDGTIYGIKDDA